MYADLFANAIILTKSEARNAGKPGTETYADLMNLRRDFPNYPNLVFAKLQHAVDMFAGKNNLADHPYYWKLVRYNFSDFNNIYECDLLRTFGKAMLPF